MSDSQIPVDVRDLIVRAVETIGHLEVLLLLREHASRGWTAQAVANELRMTTAAAALRLDELCSRGLIDVRTANDLVYRYSPLTAELDETVTRLAGEYRERRAAVTALISSMPERSADPRRPPRK